MNLPSEDARWTTTNDDGSREDGRLTREDDELPTRTWPPYGWKLVFVREKMRAGRDVVHVFREKMAPFRFGVALVRGERAFVRVKMRVVRVADGDLPTEDDELRMSGGVLTIRGGTSTRADRRPARSSGGSASKSVSLRRSRGP